VPANGKLYFEAFGINSMLQNNLPHVGEGNAPKSYFRQKQSPLKSKKYGNRKKQTASGRAANPKPTPARHRYAIYMNDAENVRFLSMCEDTGMEDKSRFIKSILFQKELKVVKIDKAAMDYYMRPTTFYAQFRAIGNNYNQATKALKSTFMEKKALAFLYKLENATRELVAINQKIIDLTKVFKAKWLQK
jgi:hypothetical protein